MRHSAQDLTVAKSSLAALVAFTLASQSLAEEPQRGTAATPQPAAAGTRITGKDGAPMVLVPAGEFLMGSKEGDDDETPVHRVFLDAYYIDKHEVTATRYARFLEGSNRPHPLKWNEVSFETQGDRPVIGVDWYDAEAYCRWTGERLPTEAEWEKAARGTDGRTYPWGNEAPTDRHANFNKCCNWNGYNTLTAVTRFEAGASPYGALNMLGNVWEWVADWYDEHYYEYSPDRNPTGPAHGFRKLLRGGSWTDGFLYVRSADRNSDVPTLRNVNVGFRCVMDGPK
jgi:formylglycine-generating enzyme required for sulfatase activity